MATTQISLIREHSEAIRPPRALWVPYELGRPLGVPGDADFQRGVLCAALALLAEPAGPVLTDYLVEAPTSPGDAEPWACALPQPPLPAPGSEREALMQRFLAEISSLRPWYDEGLKVRARSALGVSGLGVEGITAMAEGLVAAAFGEVTAAPAGARHEMPLLLRFFADDLKAYYFEAAAAQPRSRTPSPGELNRWLFGETAFGDVLYAARDRLIASEDRAWQLPGRFMVPAAYSRRPGS